MTFSKHLVGEQLAQLDSLISKSTQSSLSKSTLHCPLLGFPPGDLLYVAHCPCSAHVRLTASHTSQGQSSSQRSTDTAPRYQQGAWGSHGQQPGSSGVGYTPQRLTEEPAFHFQALVPSSAHIPGF